MEDIKWNKGEGRVYTMSNDILTITIERNLDGWHVSCPELALNKEKMSIKNETPIPIAQVEAMNIIVGRLINFCESVGLRILKEVKTQNKSLDIFRK
jgi:uncharacterized protein YhdP